LLRLANRIVAGFHELEQPGRVFDTSADCLLPEQSIADAWAQLRSAWGQRAELLPSGPKLRLTLRGAADGAVSLVIEGGYSAGRPDDLIAAAPLIRSIWHRPRPDVPLVLLAGAAAIQESWQDEDLDLSGSVFLQVNRAAAQLLEDYVAEVVGDVSGRKLLDLYCGVGLHARRFARAGARVVGVELDELAVAEARAAGVENAEFVQGRAEDEMPKYLPADVVILNPPRSGIHESAATILRRKPVRKVIYISCNPATLARDLGRIGPRYRLASMRCFDLFPQTAHVETVVELTCGTS